MMHLTKTRRLLAPLMLGGMIGLATAAAAQVPAQTVEPMIPATGTVLDVSAQGRTTRVPDMATIRAGVTTQAPTAAAALAENSQRMARILAALRRAGIAERDIASAAVNLSPQYRYAENQPPVITGYQAGNTVSVRFRDVARAGTVLDTLVKEGANQIDGPSLSLADPDAALDEARTDAVRRARARAETYAKAAGMRVTRIVSIAENGQNDGGSPTPPVVMMRMQASDARTEIAPGEKDVSVDLTVRFLLN